MYTGFLIILIHILIHYNGCTVIAYLSKDLNRGMQTFYLYLYICLLCLKKLLLKGPRVGDALYNYT